MKPLHCRGFYGLGDQLYLYPFIKGAMKHREVWLETPWPQLWWGLVNDGLHLVAKKATVLRTQTLNLLVTPSSAWSDKPIPQNAEFINPNYTFEMRRKAKTIMAGIKRSFSTLPAEWQHPLKQKWLHEIRAFLRGPDYIVYKPVTTRSDWYCPARNPEPGVTKRAVAAIKERFPHIWIVSVAHLCPGHEQLTEPPIDVDVELHKGELSPGGLLALVSGSKGVVGPVGWTVPVALSYRVPMLACCGGYMRSSALSDRMMGAFAVENLTTMNPLAQCHCLQLDCDCSKEIADAEFKRALRQFTRNVGQFI